MAHWGPLNTHFSTLDINSSKNRKFPELKARKFVGNGFFFQLFNFAGTSTWAYFVTVKMGTWPTVAGEKGRTSNFSLVFPKHLIYKYTEYLIKNFNYFENVCPHTQFKL